MHFRASIGGRKWRAQGTSAGPRGVGLQVGLGDHSMGQGATFFRLHHVVYCPSLGARLDAVFMHGLSQIACMVRPSIEQGIWGASRGSRAPFARSLPINAAFRMCVM